MKIFRVISVLGCVAVVHSQETPVPPVPSATVPFSTAPFPGHESRVTGKPVEGPAWLGFKVAKPDAGTRAHLPDLPVGMGFVIQSVDAKGPAEAGGLLSQDVIWKFADQFLVNEGQLAVLLRQKKPGDVVTISLFRGGRPMEIPLTIGEFPLNRPVISGPTMEAVVMPPEDSGMITRIINRESRTASLNVDEGKAALRRIESGSGYELEIRANDGSLIFNGNLDAAGNADAVPEAWRMRVRALRRGLDAALDGRMENLRMPRPRVVPSPPQKDSGE